MKIWFMLPFNRSRIRKAVQRSGSQRYILYVLLAFAASVSITRLFLSLTGYPKIGSGELHIAHVLWGGLILFIATLVPLLFANRWAYTLSALLSGVGVGLFIDEVGKFITQSNNYFYPAAAPIVYGVFLLTLLVYTMTRRHHPHDVRTELYALFDDLQEVLDNDLDEREHRRILDNLDHIRSQTDHPDLLALADSLEAFVHSKQLSLVPGTPGPVMRLLYRLNARVEKVVTRSRLKASLVAGLALLGLWSLVYPVRILFQIQVPGQIQFVLADLVNQGMIRTSLGLHGFEIRLALELSVSLVDLTAAVLLLIRRERRGLNLGFIGLIFSLALVDTVVFYFNQFTTIANVIVQSLVLLGLLAYRRRFFLREPPIKDR